MERRLSFVARIVVVTSAAALFGVVFGPTPVIAIQGGAGDLWYDDQRKSIDKRLIGEPELLTGSYTYEYPFVLPPGREALTPDLQLTYSSQPDENTSIFGYGWAINIPYIQRKNVRGVDKLYTDNAFYSSLSGELASTSATTYEPKYDDEKNLDYTFSTTTNTWSMVDKSGLTYTFGSTTAARQENASSTLTYTWMLEEVRDKNDNFISYSYVTDSGQIYPATTTYTGHGSTDGIFSIEFIREGRADYATSSRAQFPVVAKYRIGEIQVKVNGTWVRKYTLSYDTGDNQKRSLLKSITESGQAESGGTLSLPATSFAYQASTTNWTSNTSWRSPYYFWNGADLGVRIADVNGDGLPDIMRGYAGNPQQMETRINTGSGYQIDTTWTPPHSFTDGSVDAGARFADVNGDGLVDELVYKTFPDGAMSSTTYINTGAGWTASSTWKLPPGISFVNNYIDQGWRIADLNADGLADLMQSNDGTRVSYINTGAGWATSTAWRAPIDFIVSNNDNGVRIADVNGDSLPDLVQGFRNQIGAEKHVFMNTGAGWQLDPSWVVPLSFVNLGGSAGEDEGVRLGDINGDGLPDLVQSKDFGGGDLQKNVYINTGAGWVLRAGWQPPQYFVITSSENGARLEDVNGDGALDFLYAKDIGGAYNEAYISNTRRTDEIVQVVSPRGASTTIAYKPSSLYIDGTGVRYNAKLPFVFDTVNSISTDDGFSTTTTATFEYGGGAFYYGAPHDKRFAGFATSTTIDALANKRITFLHQGNFSNSNEGEIDDHFSKIGKVFKVETRNSANGLLKKEIVKWSADSLGNGRYLVTPLDSIDYSYEGNSSHKDRADSYAYDTSTGNISQKIEWGEVTASDSGAFIDTGSDKYSIFYTYATGTNISLPSSQRKVDSATTTVQESNLYYDDGSFGSIATGNVTKQETRIDGTTFASTTKAYNSYGLVTSERDARYKLTTYAIDANNLYVATTTNPAGHATGYTYDYSSGKKKTLQTPNNHTYTYSYDAFDRLTEEKAPDPSSGTPVAKTTITYTDTQLAAKTLRSDSLDGSSAVDTHTYLDGLERIVQAKREAEDGLFIAKDYIYNNVGKLYQESLPYFSGSSSNTGVASSSSLFSTYGYDALNRITTKTDAAGVTTITYDDWKKTVSDPLDNIKSYYSDAFGNLSAIDEVNGTSTYTTQYQYNGLQNLTKIIDTDGNVRNFTYDLLGRQTKTEDLHAPADTSFGSTTIAYDLAGNVLSKTMPLNDTINYTYDDIDRALTEDHTGQGGTEVIYTYDSCTNGKPLLCAASSASATTTYAYNPLGLPATVTTTVSSTDYVTGFEYDRLRNQTYITYPDTSVVKYTYGTGGQVDTVSRRKPGSVLYVNAMSNIDYAPTGAVRQKEFGNTLTSTYTYDANALYRLTNILTAGVGTTSDVGVLGMVGGTLFGNLAKAESGVLAIEAGDPADLLELLEAMSQGELSNDPADTTSDEIIDMGATSTSEVEKTDADTFSETSVSATSTNDVIEFVPTNTSTSTPQVAGETEMATEVEIAVSSPAAESDPTPTTDISSMLAGKTSSERASLKGEEIAKVGPVGRTTRANYDIEIATLEAIDGGVQVFVRAWDKNGQIGFGVDGSVDMERFRIFNPPVLVPDPSGAIVTEWIDTISDERREIRYREDPKEALLQTIEHNLSVLKNRHGSERIIEGKRGSTVSTFYPDANPESTSVDGFTEHDIGNYGQVSFSSIRADTSATVANDSGSAMNLVGLQASENQNGNFIDLQRSFTLFDTSALPDTDTIASATVSLYGVAKRDDNGTQWSAAAKDIELVSGVPASNTSLSTSDIDVANFGGTEYAVASFSSWTITGYNDFSLNASGIANISTTSVSKFGWMQGADFDNSNPGTGAVNGFTGVSAKAADQSGTTQDPKLVVEHHPDNYEPSAPTSLLVEGQTNPGAISDSTPEFSAIYVDQDASDAATYYQIEVATSSDFATTHWDSSKTALASSTSQGTRIADVSYAGSVLASSTTYYWRIRFWDTDNATGTWSTATSTFSLAATGTFIVNAIQNISFTYDAVGNITAITDTATTTGLSRTVVYGYDDLYRLTSASTTDAASASFIQAYVYNGIGSITNKSDVGSYSYAGTGYANPHAVTSIGDGMATTTYSYDNNGNLTSAGAFAYTWDYRNRLTQVATGTATTTFGYDYNNDRVFKGNGVATTTYVSKYFTQQGASTTAYIYLPNGELIVDVTGNGAATSTTYYHLDHLGSVNVTTDSDGLAVQVLDYYPYGSTRINNQTGSSDSERKFAGMRRDDTGLDYAMNRYYDSARGQFSSEDPVHLAIGNPALVQRLTGQDQQMLLSDPQILNSYSWGRDNPINRSDPSGLFNIKTGAVEKGDTLSAITGLLNKTYGTSYSVSTVATLNNISNPNKIFVGQTIIPSQKVPDVSVSLTSLMKTNAGTINSLPAVVQKPYFVGMVFPTLGPWDLKVNNPAYNSSTYKDGFVFMGEKIRSDAPGNIHYGFTGKAAGFSDSALIGGASTAQVGWDIAHGRIPSGDNSGDAAYIQQGINLYNNQ